MLFQGAVQSTEAQSNFPKIAQQQRGNSNPSFLLFCSIMLSGSDTEANMRAEEWLHLPVLGRPLRGGWRCVLLIGLVLRSKEGVVEVPFHTPR